MSAAKHDVESLLRKLPDDCSLEDVQYHLYVLEKVRRGLDEARERGTISQEEAETRLTKWLTE
jgi:hypothetical protein